MTNELEEQFFQCFGIKPKTNQVYGMQLDYHIDDYPQITDRVLLELICILNNYGCTSFAGNLAMLKNEVLRNSIMCCEDTDNDKFKHQVRTLFEEEKWIL